MQVRLGEWVAVHTPPRARLALNDVGAIAYVSRREVVDIGTWEGRASHPISVRLSPLHIKAAGDEKMTLESFWQSRNCLAVWDGGE